MYVHVQAVTLLLLRKADDHIAKNTTSKEIYINVRSVNKIFKETSEYENKQSACFQKAAGG